MPVEQMRAAILAVYPGKKWQKKVSKMYDDQVIAIYNSFLRTGKFDQKEEPRKPTKKPDRKESPKFEAWTGEQISLF